MKHILSVNSASWLLRKIGIDIKWQGSDANEVGNDSASGKTLIKINPEFFRPAEVDLLLGDPAKAEQKLGWKRQVDFPGLVKMMVAHDLKVEA